MISQILNRAMTNKAEPDTIGNIIARIRQPPALKAAMERWRELQRQHAEKSNQLREAVA